MKDFRFYKEYDSPQDKRKDKGNGNVFALYLPTEHELVGAPEGLGAVYFHANSPVAWTGCSHDCLRTQAKRIPEAEARAIHPALFERLDSTEGE